MGMGPGLGTSWGLKTVGAVGKLGTVGLLLYGKDVTKMALPGILGKVVSGIGKVAKGFLGIGGGVVAAGVGGAAVGAIAARAGTGGKRRRGRRRGLSMKEVKDLMMMKAVMGPGCAKSPAFQLAMMKAMG